METPESVSSETQIVVLFFARKKPVLLAIPRAHSTPQCLIILLIRKISRTTKKRKRSSEESFPRSLAHDKKK
jgi:hypothetical protein